MDTAILLPYRVHFNRGGSEKEMEATGGFEAPNRGFADPRVRGFQPGALTRLLGYRTPSEALTSAPVRILNPGALEDSGTQP